MPRSGPKACGTSAGADEEGTDWHVLAGQALNKLAKRKRHCSCSSRRTTAGPSNERRFALDTAYLLRMIAMLCAKTGDYQRAKLFIETYLDAYPDDEAGHHS